MILRSPRSCFFVSVGTLKLVGDLEEELRKGCPEAQQAELVAGLEAIKHMKQMMHFQQPVQADAAVAGPSGGLGSWMQSRVTVHHFIKILPSTASVISSLHLARIAASDLSYFTACSDCWYYRDGSVVLSS